MALSKRIPNVFSSLVLMTTLHIPEVSACVTSYIVTVSMHVFSLLLDYKNGNLGCVACHHQPSSMPSTFVDGLLSVRHVACSLEKERMGQTRRLSSKNLKSRKEYKVGAYYYHYLVEDKHIKRIIGVFSKSITGMLVFFFF